MSSRRPVFGAPPLFVRGRFQRVLVIEGRRQSFITLLAVTQTVLHGRTFETYRTLTRKLKANIRIVDMYSTMEIQLPFYFFLRLEF